MQGSSIGMFFRSLKIMFLLSVASMFSLLCQKKIYKNKRKIQNYFGDFAVANHSETFFYLKFIPILINICLLGSKQLCFYVLIHLFIQYF